MTKTNEVYKTSDLSIFKSIDGNRVPNAQHIKRLKNSILENGMKCNPILVNEKMQVIDGQHRLFAAKDAGSYIYYIIINGYSLDEVHTLNLNQKNWTKKDFMDGYSNMGIDSYMRLKKFYKLNKDFTFTDCISLCSNLTSHISKENKKNFHVFEEGTWLGGDFSLAQDNANKIRMIKNYYDGYNRSTFAMTIAGLFTKDNFNFSELMHKIRLQPTALVDCASRDQYRTLIEDIYNYRSRNKVSLKY